MALIDSGSSNNPVYYYHNDHLGTPQRLTNQTKDISWQASYTPFGEAVISVETVTQNIRFPGQYYDDETGLHYNWYRYYDPSLGRYITSDPIGLEGGLNTYGYALQNPVRYTDPRGLAVPLILPALPAIGKIVGPLIGIGIGIGVGSTMNNTHLGPWTGSTTRDDPDAAGQEASDEIDKEGSCSGGPNDPEKGKEVARKCKQKCIDKAVEGYGGSMSEWIGRCELSCTSAQGCGNFFP